jgi:hypothetical protein
MEILRELARYFWAHRKWWLLPVVLALLIIGTLAAITAASPLATFIYPMF